MSSIIPTVRFSCFLVLCSALLSIGCHKAGPSSEVFFAKKNGVESPKVAVELALDPSEHARGLMYVKSMPEQQGMLFIFPKEEQRSFWMKNTYLELDMIFVNSDQRIVSITHRAVPLSETPRPSNRPAKFVLEVGGGLAEKWGLAEGDLMKVTGPAEAHLR